MIGSPFDLTYYYVMTVETQINGAVDRPGMCYDHDYFADVNGKSALSAK